MPMLFTTKPIVLKQKPDPTIKKAARIANAGRRKTKEYDDSQIYGADLFEPVMKREREIIIKFRGEFTDEGIHFSIDGRFGYKLTHARQDKNDYDLFNLYYCTEPVIDPPKDFILILTEKIIVYENVDGSTLEEKCIELRKEELKIEKEKFIEELRIKEKLEQVQKDFVEKQLDRIENSQIVSGGENHAADQSANKRENELLMQNEQIFAGQDTKNATIQVQEFEKEETIGNKDKEKSGRIIGEGFSLL